MQHRFASTISCATAFIRQERGATAIEYGLIAAAIAVAISAAIFAFGDGLADIFSTSAAKVAARP